MYKFWFECKKNGNFINFAYVCDNQKNCQNGEDEENCNILNYEKFLCKDQSEINYLLVCNFIDDCQDGSDEEFCGKFFT